MFLATRDHARYDFIVYAQLSTVLTQLFFPSSDPATAALAFWGVFAVGCARTGGAAHGPGVPNAYAAVLSARVQTPALLCANMHPPPADL